MSWSWEYLPSEEHVTGGAPAGFLAAVEQKAAELVRAAEALHLDGTTYEGSGEPMLQVSQGDGVHASGSAGLRPRSLG